MTPEAAIGGNARPEAGVRQELYLSMLRTRRVEEAIVDRYAEQEMRCPVHICIGQEAPPTGVSAHLQKQDHVYSAHRSHGHYLAKGGDMPAMIAEIYGKADGCAVGKGGSQHLIDLEAGFICSAPILASTISVGVGDAWAARRRGEDRVIVIYFGDGSTEEGAFHEALNFAGVNKLPIVFVCENNLYSVHTLLETRQPENQTVRRLGPPNGMESFDGDGNDVEEVWRLAEYAVNKARNGGGPTLLEFHTYRWMEHCGPLDDTHLGYRSVEELESWKARCPVDTYRDRLMEDGCVDQAWLDAEEKTLHNEIEAAFTAAQNSPFPNAEELFRHVYPE